MRGAHRPGSLHAALEQTPYEVDPADELKSIRAIAAKLAKAPGSGPPRWLNDVRRERRRAGLRNARAWIATMAVVGVIIALAARVLAG